MPPRSMGLRVSPCGGATCCVAGSAAECFSTTTPCPLAHQTIGVWRAGVISPRPDGRQTVVSTFTTMAPWASQPPTNQNCSRSSWSAEMAPRRSLFIASTISCPRQTSSQVRNNSLPLGGRSFPSSASPTSTLATSSESPTLPSVSYTHLTLPTTPYV